MKMDLGKVINLKNQERAKEHQEFYNPACEKCHKKAKRHNLSFLEKLIMDFKTSGHAEDYVIECLHCGHVKMGFYCGP